MTALTPAEQLVDETIAAQRAKGRAKYGKGLDALDGHDWLVEALQELADTVQYLGAEVVRLRARPTPLPVTPEERLNYITARWGGVLDRLAPNDVAALAPATTRIRKALIVAVEATDAEQDAHDKAGRIIGTPNAEQGAAFRAFGSLVRAQHAFTLACIADLPAILDAVDAGPTFLEHHARTLEAKRLRDELAAAKAEIEAGRQTASDLIRGGHASTSELFNRLNEIAGRP